MGSENHPLPPAPSPVLTRLRQCLGMHRAVIGYIHQKELDQLIGINLVALMAALAHQGISRVRKDTEVAMSLHQQRDKASQTLSINCFLSLYFVILERSNKPEDLN